MVKNFAVLTPQELGARASLSIVASTLWGGFVAGTADVIAACLINGVGPVLILQTVASGVLGRAAYGGGLASASLGLLLQWAMSNIIALVFAAGGHWLPVLGQRWVTAGLAYGAVIFFVMNFVVLPVSAVPRLPHFSLEYFAENLTAMLLFGLIVAFCARHRAPD